MIDWLKVVKGKEGRDSGDDPGDTADADNQEPDYAYDDTGPVSTGFAPTPPPPSRGRHVSPSLSPSSSSSSSSSPGNAQDEVTPPPPPSTREVAQPPLPEVEEGAVSDPPAAAPGVPPAPAPRPAAAAPSIPAIPASRHSVATPVPAPAAVPSSRRSTPQTGDETTNNYFQQQHGPEVVGVLIVKEGLQRGTLYPVIEGENVIGRAATVEIRTDERDNTVSRQHAVIITEQGRFGIKPLVEDKNPTFLNEEPVSVGAELRDGDLIRVGQITLKFRET